ncbi:MAG: hypothetical protein SV062_12580 [Thermodesulfobacteriota bacterium]|nr:hypothetical protein [Thermodesulfobacteriota bacterium]
MSEFLYILENEVQIVALSFMGIVYILRIWWLTRYKASIERQAPTHSPSSGGESAGIMFSMMNVAMPWSMESTRNSKTVITYSKEKWGNQVEVKRLAGLGFYLQFTIFHIAALLTIGVTFIIPYWPFILENKTVVLIFQIIVACGLLVGLYRLYRRLSNPVMRAISTPDDIFSLLLLDAFLISALFAIPNNYEKSEWPLIIFFIMTTFFLIYVPFSKISHYLYYPFTRFYLGKTFGRRGTYPKGKTGTR